jgi:hypothetical protein
LENVPVDKNDNEVPVNAKEKQKEKKGGLLHRMCDFSQGLLFTTCSVLYSYQHWILTTDYQV